MKVNFNPLLNRQLLTCEIESKATLTLNAPNFSKFNSFNIIRVLTVKASQSDYKDIVTDILRKFSCKTASYRACIDKVDIIAS